MPPVRSVRIDIISIGTLSQNRLWGETQPVRTPHATTSLIRTGKRNILIDPGLPAPAIGARLFERTGLKPEQIDAVFLTNFRPAHRAGLSTFTRAKVFIHEREKEQAAAYIETQIEELPQDDEQRPLLLAEQKLLESFQDAPDKLAEQVDLFPLFGYTPGTCGLLIAAPTYTALVAGDAVPTLDHFLAWHLLPDSFYTNAAGEAMREVYEIADWIVPGHDNIFANPRSAGL
jgi:glyoxylase-like metal-dependent hydrolase (beta-lactamase superfamily II)